MDEEVTDVCSECENGYVQFGPGVRGLCPFCDGTGLRSRQLYVILSATPAWLRDVREYHARMKIQRQRWIDTVRQ